MWRFSTLPRLTGAPWRPIRWHGSCIAPLVPPGSGGESNVSGSSRLLEKSLGPGGHFSLGIPMRALLLPLVFLLACKDDDSSATEKEGGAGDDTGNGGGCESPTAWFIDADGDGYGSDAANVSACEAPEGYVATADDCDDNRADVHPGATEDDCTDPVDYNCDGSVGTADGDGDGVAACEGDCDDGDAAVNPAAQEVCDGIDDDCDGTTDAGAVDAATWYTDMDGDGYGVEDGASTTACDQPAGYAATADDCDDADAAFHAGADESDCADPNDYNCDGSVGYADADGDGAPACEDCDDADGAVNPSAIEVCNGIDDDCDADADGTAVDRGTYYADVDADGFGDPGAAASACGEGDGLVADATDCDDGASATWPGADEVCDGADSDCDGDTDEDAIDATSWYDDVDGDGFGDDAAVTVACDAPADTVATGGDCDAADPDVNPGATEACNGVDDDCDGATDEGVLTTSYDDADGDGYGDAATGASACTATGTEVTEGTDCDDGDADANPGMSERCDGVDNDCDGLTSDEAGLAAWQDSAGTWLDVTATLAAGTPTSPVYIGDGSGYALPATDGTVYLCAGTWYVKVVLGTSTSDLAVVGLDGAASTTITTGGTTSGATGSVVAVSNASLALEGLTISGGIGSSGTKGGGIVAAQTMGGAVPSTPNVTLTDCIVSGNETDYGGGIAVQNYGWVDLVDTVVEGNTATFAGGGVWVQSAGKLSCTATFLGAAGIVANSSPTGGGVYLSSSSAGEVDAVGCDWGEDGDGDDNATYDIQQQPSASHRYCYTNATALTDAVACSGGSCTASTDSTCP